MNYFDTLKAAFASGEWRATAAAIVVIIALMVL